MQSNGGADRGWAGSDAPRSTISEVNGFGRRSGGEVRITSEVGEDTTICIYLPRHYGKADKQAPAATRAVLAPSRQGETVLVGDDEPTVQMLVTDILADLGYAALEEADSATELRVLRSDVRIDLLVTDIGLPSGVNGRQMVAAAHGPAGPENAVHHRLRGELGAE